jgi:hypothetical protein
LFGTINQSSNQQHARKSTIADYSRHMVDGTYCLLPFDEYDYGFESRLGRKYMSSSIFVFSCVNTGIVVDHYPIQGVLPNYQKFP